MPQYYLWAFPDGGSQWIGVGWVYADYQRRTVPYGYNDVTKSVDKFPLDDAGWWYAQPATGGSAQMGRYERSYYSASLPGMTRTVSSSVV